MNHAKEFLTSTDKDAVETEMETLENAFQKFSEMRVNNALKQAIVGHNIYSENESQ